MDLLSFFKKAPMAAAAAAKKVPAAGGPTPAAASAEPKAAEPAPSIKAEKKKPTAAKVEPQPAAVPEEAAAAAAKEVEVAAAVKTAAAADGSDVEVDEDEDEEPLTIAPGAAASPPDTVWVKYDDYPWWPAKLAADPETGQWRREGKKQVEARVVFYGDDSECWLPAKSIKPFVANWDRYRSSRETATMLLLPPHTHSQRAAAA